MPVPIAFPLRRAFRAAGIAVGSRETTTASPSARSACATVYIDWSSCKLAFFVNRPEEQLRGGWTAALLRSTFPEATARDWGLYWGAKYYLILLHPPVQRESEKGSPMDVEGKMSERATNRPSAIFLQEGVGRVPRNMGCLGLLVILLGLLVVCVGAIYARQTNI